MSKELSSEERIYRQCRDHVTKRYGLQGLTLITPDVHRALLVTEVAMVIAQVWDESTPAHRAVITLQHAITRANEDTQS